MHAAQGAGAPAERQAGLRGRSSVVRELHVYGTAVAVHARDAGKHQHQVRLRPTPSRLLRALAVCTPDVPPPSPISCLDSQYAHLTSHDPPPPSESSPPPPVAAVAPAWQTKQQHPRKQIQVDIQS